MYIARPDHASIPSKIIDREAIYQQALNDFAVRDLLAEIQNSQHITSPESEMIAALLVEQLATNLDSHLVAAYLEAIEQGKREIIPEPISMEYPKSTELPANFPTAAPAPRFNYGDRTRLCFVPINGETEGETDTGQCIGHYYAYAPHHCEWMWKYVIWLDKESVSASWCVATTAWEDQLKPLPQEELV